MLFKRLAVSNFCFLFFLNDEYERFCFFFPILPSVICSCSMRWLSPCTFFFFFFHRLAAVEMYLRCQSSLLNLYRGLYSLPPCRDGYMWNDGSWSQDTTRTRSLTWLSTIQRNIAVQPLDTPSRISTLTV